MEYTIQKLAELAGVTTRTLRWYHRIGLLTPSRIGENGYRYYGGAEVDRPGSEPFWMIHPLTGWTRSGAIWPPWKRKRGVSRN